MGTLHSDFNNKVGFFGNSWQGSPDFSGITIKPVLSGFGTAP